MADTDESVRQRVDRLHGEEDREIDRADRLPEGVEKDRHRMHGERLSDEAWAIEEATDVDFKPSGLWPKRDAG